MKRIFNLLLLLIVLCCCAEAAAPSQPPETAPAPPVYTEPAEIYPPSTEPPETTQPFPDWEVLQAPDSTCFTVISYCRADFLLRVQFRNSGQWYVYHEVEPEVWSAFKRADSKGGYFNDYIKGLYDYTRE